MSTKFSQFAAGGIVRSTDITVGLRAALNTQFTNTGVGDASGNLILYYATGAVSAVNYLSAANAATGSGPSLGSAGTDTNINLTLAAKGTGSVILSSTALEATNTGFEILPGVVGSVAVSNPAVTSDKK